MAGHNYTTAWSEISFRPLCLQTRIGERVSYSCVMCSGGLRRGSILVTSERGTYGIHAKCAREALREYRRESR